MYGYLWLKNWGQSSENGNLARRWGFIKVVWRELQGAHTHTETQPHMYIYIYIYTYTDAYTYTYAYTYAYVYK